MDTNKANGRFWICLPFSMAQAFCISNCTIKKEQTSIVGDWQITEISSAAGVTEKPPGLTAYSFYKDSAYLVYYAPKTGNVIRYSGTYAVTDKYQPLITNYTFGNSQTRDTARILLLTDSLMTLKRNGKEETP